MTDVAKTQENLKKCYCMKCPTYAYAAKAKDIPHDVTTMLAEVNKAKHIEAMYCAFGQSEFLEIEKGCLCSACQVFKENGLRNNYFCRITGGK